MKSKRMRHCTLEQLYYLHHSADLAFGQSAGLLIGHFVPVVFGDVLLTVPLIQHDLVTELALEFAGIMRSKVSFQPFPGEHFVANWTPLVFLIKLH